MRLCITFDRTNTSLHIILTHLSQVIFISEIPLLTSLSYHGSRTKWFPLSMGSHTKKEPFCSAPVISLYPGLSMLTKDILNFILLRILLFVIMALTQAAQNQTGTVRRGSKILDSRYIFRQDLHYGICTWISHHTTSPFSYLLLILGPLIRFLSVFAYLILSCLFLFPFFFTLHSSTSEVWALHIKTSTPLTNLTPTYPTKKQIGPNSTQYQIPNSGPGPGPTPVSNLDPDPDQLRRHISPLRELCPSLFSVISGAACNGPVGINFDRREEDDVSSSFNIIFILFLFDQNRLHLIQLKTCFVDTLIV